MATMIEVERKYTLPARFRLPDLRHVAGVGGVDSADDLSLDATYFDTATLALAARRVTLRQRLGGHDAGWHLKTPAGAHRAERHEPLGPEEFGPAVPAVLAGQVRAIIRREPLIPVARLRTRRRERAVHAPDGTVLALISDDSVTAEDLVDRDRVDRWRELEVELVGGTAGLLDAIDEALWAAGARPSASPSKLAQALGPRMPPAYRSIPSGDPIADYLRAQRDAVMANDPLVRDGDEDGVHDMRVALRRTRATLRTFWPDGEPFGEELHWLAGLLGGVRDGDVLAGRFDRRLDEYDEDDIVGPVRERIRERLDLDTSAARATLDEALSGERYLTLLDAFDELVETPPEKSRPAELRRAARRAVRRADRKLDVARFARRHGASGSNIAFHDARKAYKRARYAVELVIPVVGRPAAKLAVRLAALQDVLGEHQDAVVAADLLRVLAKSVAAAGDNAYTYGLLRARELDDAEHWLDRVPAARHRARRPKLRGALDG